MTPTDMLLLFVIVSITGVTIALLRIRQSIDGLAAEIRKRDADQRKE